MKNANQIRQFLNSILEIPWQPTSIRTNQGFMVGILADDKDFIFESIQEALALLPCKTCNGSGFVQAECEACAIGVSHSASECGGGKPCPDCQPTEEPLDFQEILDCWSVHPIDDEDCVSCSQMYECRDFRKEQK